MTERQTVDVLQPVSSRCVNIAPLLCLLQIQGSIRPHAIIILPNSAGTEVLVCYEDEGVYIDTYGRITKDTVLQWGEMPASVGTFPQEQQRTFTAVQTLLHTEPSVSSLLLKHCCTSRMFGRQSEVFRPF